jgi:Tfp pilus assembly PilM family ATPase
MLSSLIQPNYPRAALGLEKDSITALALQKESRGQFGIKQAASMDLPVGLLSPNFIEQNISNDNEMLLLLRQVVEDAGLLRNKRWSVSLPANTARTTILTLDEIPTSKSELEDILDWKAEQSFGVPSGELRISLEKISPGRTDKPRYFATAIKLSVIDEYETLFETLGWKAGLILPRAISESNWLMSNTNQDYSLMISSQDDGFTALLLNGREPAVVRSVTCSIDEMDDEIYRLLVYYQDRFAVEHDSNKLRNFLVIGKELEHDRIHEITTEALGEKLNILSPEEVGLNLPISNLNFDDIAAPAGIAKLGWK